LLNKQSLLYTPNNKNSSEMVPPLTRQQRNTQQLLEKLKEGTSGTQSILSKGRAYKLIKKGADVNVKEVENRTPLHWAIWNNPKLASVLIDKGADIRARDEHGDTSLIGPQVKEIWQ
jgi:ankyrin repeat protein